jgi:hypothetical protein
MKSGVVTDNNKRDFVTVSLAVLNLCCIRHIEKKMWGGKTKS